MTWPTSNPLARLLDDRWKESQSLWQQWWYEADLDTKMMTGQQDYWNTFYNINYRNQKILMFNKLLRVKNMVGGYQRDNRLASIVIPSDNNPDFGVTADQKTKLISWIKREDQTYEKISDCFEGGITCGLNLMQIWMDFREDPENGEIKTYRYPFNAFLMDPYWTQADLSDCDWIWTRKYLSEDKLLSIFPNIKKDIPYLGKGYAAKDGKFQFLAQNWQVYNQSMYAYDEYWERDFREIEKIVDRVTGEMVEWKGTKDQFKYFKRFNPNVELIKSSIPTIKWSVLVNNQVVYEEKSPYGLDRFPFVPFVCYHFPEVQNYAYRYQGIIRNARDSQIELNRRRNRMLDILDAQIQSGLMVKEDALVNPEDAFFQGPGKVLYFKQTANLASDVAPIPTPPVGAGWMELTQSIETEITDIIGPEELFAQNMGAKDMNGVMMKLKMGAGLIGLRDIFDRVNQSQISVADIMLDLAEKNFSVDKVRKILGEEPTPDFFDSANTRYHCVVEEGELTATQRQLKFIQLLQLKQIIPDAIDNDDLLEASTIQGKKDLIDKAKMRQEQAAELQQLQQQQAMQQQAILTRSIEAKAQNDFASAAERRTRAVSNIGLDKERSAQADHDRAKTALDNAKALHELSQLPEERLMKLADFILSMEERQHALSLGQESESEEDAKQVGVEVDLKEMETDPKMQNQSSALQDNLQ